MVKKKTKSEKPKNIIHVRLSYDEARKGKEEILTSEVNLLKILKQINNYKKLRNQEFQKKIKIVQKIKEIKSKINKLKLILPKYKKPEILLHGEDEITINEKTKNNSKIKNKNLSLDSQLENIQKKLKVLQEN